MPGQRTAVHADGGHGIDVSKLCQPGFKETAVEGQGEIHENQA